MSRKILSWTDEKRQLLSKMWFSSKKEELLREFYPLNYHAIEVYANKRGLKRDSKRNGDLSPLLNDTPETYYWTGFIMADGNLNKNNHLIVQLSKKDKVHLEKLAEFLGTNCTPIGSDMYRVALMHKGKSSLFRDKFDLHYRKTYNPPSIEIFYKMPDYLFTSLIIGFIDGDGSILKNGSGIRIWNHFSWNTFHSYIRDFLYKKSNITKTGNEVKLVKNGKYSYVTFHRRQMIQFLKLKTIELNLPVLERKWNRIKIINNIRGYNEISKYSTN